MPQNPDSSWNASQEEPLSDVAPGPDMLSVIWRARRRLVAVLLVAGLAYGGGALLMLALDKPRRTVSQELTFTFDGAKEGRYPNGFAFSPRDLLSEPVLESVYRSLDLAQFLKPDEFAGSLSIADAAGIEAQLLQSEFQQRLQSSKLSEPERARIEKEFRESMNRLRGEQHVLGVDLERHRIPTTLMERIATAIPARWAEFAKQTRGVAVYDVAMPVIAPWSQDEAPIDQWDRLEAEMRDLQSAADRVAALPGSSQARLPDGSSPEQVRRDILLLRRVRVEPLAEGIYRLAGEEGLRRLAANLEASEARLQLARAKTEAAREAFQQYVREARGEAYASTDGRGTAGRQEGAAPAPTTINLPESVITELIDMKTKAGDLEYRQKLNDAFVKSQADMVNAQDQVLFDKARLERLSRTPATGGSVVPAASLEMVRQLKVLLAKAGEQLRESLHLLSERNLNPSSVLYRLDGPPVVFTESSVSMRVLAAGFVGVLLAASAVGIGWSLITDRRSGAGLEARPVERLPRNSPSRQMAEV